MAKTRRAYTGGAASTTTSSAIAASGTTSFTITAYTGWPYGSDPFFVVVEPGTANEEKILVTRTGSTDTTVNVYATPSVAANRGADDTSSVAHSSGATVFPVFTALDADEANELTSSWSTKGDLVSYGSSTFETLGVGSDGALLMADSGETSGLKWAQPGYTYVQTVYFTSNGTFTKASYPWLRAIRVKVQGGGGGGGFAATTTAGQSSVGSGGGAGAYAESFITDIASLASSVTVSIGAKGDAGVAATSTSATDGGASSFGSGAAYEVSADGGGGGLDQVRTGPTTVRGGVGASSATGDLTIGGSGGHAGSVSDATVAYSGFGGKGADSVLGTSGHNNRPTQAVGASDGYGAGGTGRAESESQTGSDGQDGTAGIVIVELYA